MWSACRRSMGMWSVCRRSAVCGLSVGGQSLCGLSVGGQSVCGLSVGGQSVCGLSVGGQSVCGMSVGGQSVCGLSVGGQSVCGLSVGGQSVCGLSVLVYPVLVFRFIHLAVIRGTRSRMTMTPVYYWLIIGWPLSNTSLFIAKCTVIITQTTTRHLFPENEARLKFVAHFLIESIA